MTSMTFVAEDLQRKVICQVYLQTILAWSECCIGLELEIKPAEVIAKNPKNYMMNVSSCWARN